MTAGPPRKWGDGVSLTVDKPVGKFCVCCDQRLPDGAAVLLCLRCFKESTIKGRGDHIICNAHRNSYNPKDVTA